MVFLKIYFLTVFAVLSARRRYEVGRDIIPDGKLALFERLYNDRISNGDSKYVFMHKFKGNDLPKKVQNNPFTGASMQATRIKCIALCSQIADAMISESSLSAMPDKDTIRKCCINPCQLDVRFNWENQGPRGNVHDINDARVCMSSS